MKKMFEKPSVFIVILLLFPMLGGFEKNQTSEEEQKVVLKEVFGGKESKVKTDLESMNTFVSHNDNYKINATEEKLKLGKDTTKGETIHYQKTDLKPSTKYRITFSTKVEKNNQNLTFRVSGYKNNDPDDRENVMNFIEHLGMKNTEWSTFHYDFETSETGTMAFLQFQVDAGSTAWIDQITLTEEGEVEPNLTEPELSRGTQKFMEEGLQIQSWVTTDEDYAVREWKKPPKPEDIVDLGLTAVQYNDAPGYSKGLHERYEELQKKMPDLPNLKWGIAFGPNSNHLSSNYFEQDTVDEFDPGRTGAPSKEEIANGFLSEDQVNDVDNLINIGFGDEEDYSDTLTQTLKDWFDVSKEFYPDVLVHHNEVGNTPPEGISDISTFSEEMLRKYVQTAKPDLITYDMYYFRENRQSQEVGGTVIPFYDDLNRYRKVAAEGVDGTGLSPIPFGNYMQAWRTGPGAATPEKRGDGWYEMTESQIYLSGFANWTFGAKWLSIFRWIKDAPGYLFTDYRVDENGNKMSYYIYDQFKEMIRQSENIGEHLIHLNNKEVVIAPGQHIESGATVENSRPEDNPEWTVEQDQAFIQNIAVKNLGPTNDGLPGDLFISYFEPLPGLDMTEFFASTDPNYFMILNGLTSGNGLPAEEQKGSSYETRQEITITFDLSNGTDPSNLRKVSRLTGKTETVPLENKGDDQYEMTTVVGGGMADLYFWELGSKNIENEQRLESETTDDDRLIGDPKYAKDHEVRDLQGKTVSIGWIKGTESPIPEPLKHIDFEFQKDDQGVLLPLANPQIANYFSRLYEVNIWDRRIDRIETDSNVQIEFMPDLEWSKEELMSHISAEESGEGDENMPDILIVPDEWTWNGLMKEQMILPASSFEEFDFTERKWNKTFLEMTTYKDEIYGLYAGPTMNSVGLFANAKLLDDSELDENLVSLQNNDQWDWQKLRDIADHFKHAPNTSDKFLFAETEDLFKQMLYSNQAAPESLQNLKDDAFTMNTSSFKEAIQLYQDLNEAGLIAEKPENAPENWDVEQFNKGNILFMVKPYNQTVDLLKTEYKVQDAVVEMQDGQFLGKPEKIPVIVDATETVIEAGEFNMPADDWFFVLFPKGPSASDYSAMIDQPSYPVMLSSAKEPEDVAYVWDQLSEEFIGVEYTRFLNKYLNQRNIDKSALEKIGLKNGTWNGYEGTNVWETVLEPELMTAIKDDDVKGSFLDQLSKKAETFVTNQLSVEQSTDNLLSTLKAYQGDLDEENYRLLKTHLISVAHFEEKEDSVKVVKHLGSFKELLDHHLKINVIPQTLYDMLKSDTDALINKWK